MRLGVAILAGRPVSIPCSEARPRAGWSPGCERLRPRWNVGVTVVVAKSNAGAGRIERVAAVGPGNVESDIRSVWR